METADQDTQVQILKRIDQDVFSLINSWGEDVYGEYYTGEHRYLHAMYIPDQYTLPNEYGDYEDPEPMQYFLISKYLAEKMIKDTTRRDPIMETLDGLWIWVRCGCGYGTYDDLERYYRNFYP